MTDELKKKCTHEGVEEYLIKYGTHNETWIVNPEEYFEKMK